MEELNTVEGTSTEIKDPAAVLSALERAKADAKKFRVEKEALEQELSSFREKTTTYQTKLMTEKVISGLQKTGLPNADKLMKYIKFDSLSLSDELDVVGLDEQINSLKEDFPELFDPKKIVAGKADAGATNPTNIQLSASELQAIKVLGRG